MASGHQGPLVQYARESCLQPTSVPGRVFLRCEAGLDDAAGVLLLVRLREGFEFNGPVSVLADCSWHRDEHSTGQTPTELGTITEQTPVLITDVQPRNIGVDVLRGSHFYLHIYFDLLSSSPPSATASSSTVCAAIEQESLELSALRGEELRARVCKPLQLPHCRNLEYVYKIAKVRHDALDDERQRDRSFELEASCDFLQSGLVDRLTGQHFALRRKELSAELASLRAQQHTPKRQRTNAPPAHQASPPTRAAPSWALSENESVMYQDDEGMRRVVTVSRVLPDPDGADPRYEICWIRQTERRKLWHRDGRQLRAEDVRSLRPGHELVYNGYDVTVLRVLADADNADEEGVPRLEIKISRITTKVSRPAPE